MKKNMHGLKRRHAHRYIHREDEYTYMEVCMHKKTILYTYSVLGREVTDIEKRMHAFWKRRKRSLTHEEDKCT